MAETLVQLLVAALMSAAAVCLFVWAALSGYFTNVEAIARRFFEKEMNALEEETTGGDK